VLRGKEERLTLTTGLHTHNTDTLLFNEVIKCSDCIDPSTDTSNNYIRELASRFQHSAFDLLANHSLEVADEGGERVRSNGTSDEIVGGFEIGDPITERLVNCVFQSSRAQLDGNNLCSEHANAKDIEGLASYIFGAHIDGTFHAKPGTDGCGCYTVLSSTSFRNDTLLAYPMGEK